MAGIASCQLPCPGAEPNTSFTRLSACHVFPSADQSKKMLFDPKSHQVRYTVPFADVLTTAPSTPPGMSSGSWNGAQVEPPSSDRVTIMKLASSQAAQIRPEAATVIEALSWRPPPPGLYCTVPQS